MACESVCVLSVALARVVSGMTTERLRTIPAPILQPRPIVVGPTTTGRACKIGAGILLKRSVVMPDTTLASATLKTHTLSHAIVLGGDQPTIQALTTSSSVENDMQSM